MPRRTVRSDKQPARNTSNKTATREQLEEGYVRIYQENQTLKAKLEEANQNAVGALVKELYAQQAKLALAMELVADFVGVLAEAPTDEPARIPKDLVAQYKERAQNIRI